MAQVLSQRPPLPTLTRTNSTRSQLTYYTHSARVKPSWASLQLSLKCNGRFSCLFSNNRKEDEARKALESALGGKKTEFEKWDKEIKRREQAGGGGDSGGGGWFRWLGGSNGDHFWEEAQQTSLTILGIIAMCLIIAKGDVMIAVVLNPLLYLLRGTRTGFTFLAALVKEKLNLVSKANFCTKPQKEISAPISARENVVKKWGSS
ncbi:hypothetical protein ACH5RR_017526 [Cinchona calisaya]|uniref:Sulfate adenylyltransferase subunit 2 n=1 Tax=Cinchona calisaya TaxID=153742 RepID=A0ABD2ZML3_9GENT